MKDWIISSQAPKLAMIEHGEGSESRRLWVLNDGLINLIMLKVYSGLTRNGKDDRYDKTIQCRWNFCDELSSHINVGNRER